MKYARARQQILLARDARLGAHRVAASPVTPVRKQLNTGDRVRLRNGSETVVIGASDRGYELRGYEGKYFSAGVLERIEI